MSVQKDPDSSQEIGGLLANAQGSDVEVMSNKLPIASNQDEFATSHSNKIVPSNGTPPAISPHTSSTSQKVAPESQQEQKTVPIEQLITKKEVSIADKIISDRIKSQYIQMHSLREQDLLVDSNFQHMSQCLYPDKNLFTEPKDPPKDAELNKAVYMKNYATQFSIPTSFVLNARICGSNPDYVYQVVKFVIPGNNEKPEESNMISKIEPSPPKFFKNLEKNSMILRLNKITDQSMEYVSHVIIKKGVKPISCFSLDGSMFAYIVVEDKDAEKHLKKRNDAFIATKKTLAASHELLSSTQTTNKLFQSQIFDTDSDDQQVNSDSDDETKIVGQRKLYIVKAQDKSKPESLIDSFTTAQMNSKFTAEIDEMDEDKIYDEKGRGITRMGSLQFMSDENAVMKFDINNRALIGYGENQFFVVDLNDGSESFGTMKIYKLNRLLYDRILSMTYCTDGVLDNELYSKESQNAIGAITNDSVPQLYVAAKKKKLNQVQFFEFFQDQKDRDLLISGESPSKFKPDDDDLEQIEQNQEIEITEADKKVEKLIKNLTKHHSHIKVLNYEAEKGDPLPHITISHDFSKILFASNKQRFVVDSKGAKLKKENLNDDRFEYSNEFSQYMTPHINQKLVIRYVEEDFMNHGFYVVCSRKQDWLLRTIHTHKSKFKIKFNVNIEDEKITIYDIYINQNQSANHKSKDNILTVIGMNQNTFMHNKAIYDEIEVDKYQGDDIKSQWGQLSKRYAKELALLGKRSINDSDTLAKAAALTKLRIPQWIPFNVSHYTTSENSFWDFGAFSMSWPSVAFADSLGNVYICNGHNTIALTRIGVKHVHSDGSKHVHNHEHEEENPNQAHEKICCTYITPNQWLYVLTYCKEDKAYLLYDLNLKKRLNFFNSERVDLITQKGIRDEEAHELEFGKPILRYSSDGILNDPKSMFIRNSEGTIENGYHNRLFLFVLHGKQLYKWMQDKGMQGNETFQPDLIENEINDAYLKVGLDNNLFYLIKPRDQNGKLMRQEILQLTLGHMNFFKQRVYKEIQPFDEEIMSFDVDQHRRKVIILTKEIRKDDAMMQLSVKEYRVKILDLKSGKIQIELVVRNPEIIGLLQSGFYNLLGGHIYFANDVIKLRYDLLEKDQDSLSNLTEVQFFDRFTDVVNLIPGCKINSQNLLASNEVHRMCYIVEDLFTKELPTLLMCTPYLHERRIYLDRPKNDKSFFLTNIKMKRSLRNSTNDSIAAQIPNFKIDRSTRCNEEAVLDDDITFIIRMNLTDSKYYVYYTNGILAKRVNFINEKRMYGDAVASSFNGRYIVFRKSDSYLSLYKKIPGGPDDKEIRDSFYRFTIMELTPYKLQLVKQVDIKAGIKKLFGENTKEYMRFVAKNKHWLYGPNLDQLFERVKIQILINQRADVVVKLECRSEYSKGDVPVEFEVIDDADLKDATSSSKNYKDEVSISSETLEFIKKFNDEDRKQLFYIEQGFLNNQFLPNRNGKGVILHYFDNQTSQEKKQKYEKLKVEINADYLLFWSPTRAFTLDIEDVMTELLPDPRPINITLEERNGQGYPRIGKIFGGPRPTKVCIVRENNEDEATVINWDVDESYEINHHDVKNPYIIIYDDFVMTKAVGRSCIVIDENKVSFSDIGCNITCFDIDKQELQTLFDHEKSQSKNQFKEESLGSQKGLRFDGRNHNWILFQNYLSLPFSYMSFLIQEKLTEQDPSAMRNEFDIEAYNYMFNRSTSFMDGEFTRSEPEILENALSNMAKLNKEHLGLIQYSTRNFFQQEDEDKSGRFIDFKRRSALSVAYTNNATLCVEILLKYLTIIDHDASMQFEELFQYLIEYQEFKNYLRHIPITTSEMDKVKEFLVLKHSNRASYTYPFYTSCCKLVYNGCDCTSPAYSHMDDFVIQARGTHTIMQNLKFFEDELVKRVDNDRNYELFPTEFHEYPCKIMAIRCDWMFDRYEAPCIEKSPLAFLKNIYVTDNLDYCSIPAVQIIIQYLYEQFLIQQKDLYNILFLLFDTFFILLQLSIIQYQLTGAVEFDTDSIKTSPLDWVNVNKPPPDTSSQLAEQMAAGVNGNGTVTLKDVGQLINTQIYLLGVIQIGLMIYGALNQFDGRYETESTLSSTYRLAKELFWLFADYGFRAIIFIILYTRSDQLSNRYAIIDGVKKRDIKIPKNNQTAYQEFVKKYLLMEQFLPLMKNSSQSTLGVDVTFDWYEYEMKLFVITLIINLIYVLLKIQTRARIFFNEMAEFLDLIQAIGVKLLAFTVYSLLYVLIYAWIFHALAQYQINVDSWYDINGIIDGVYFKNDTPAAAKKLTEFQNTAVQDAKDSIEYSSYWSSAFWLYRMLLGDSPYDTFNLYNRASRSPATDALFFFYITITLILMLFLLNIIIAIMAEVQTERSANRRAVLYKAKLHYIVDRWAQIQTVIRQKDVMPKYIVGVISLEDGESTVTLEEIMDRQISQDEKVKNIDHVLNQIQKEVNKLRSYNDHQQAAKN